MILALIFLHLIAHCLVSYLPACRCQDIYGIWTISHSDCMPEKVWAEPGSKSVPIFILKSGKDSGILIFFSLRRYCVIACCILPFLIKYRKSLVTSSVAMEAVRSLTWKGWIWSKLARAVGEKRVKITTLIEKVAERAAKVRVHLIMDWPRNGSENNKQGRNQYIKSLKLS